MGDNSFGGADRYINVLSEEESTAFEKEMNLHGSGKDFSFSIDWGAIERGIVDHPKVKKLIDAAAASPGGRRAADSLRKEAQGMASVLCTSISSKYMAAVTKVAQGMFNRLWAGIIFEHKQLETLARLCQKAHKEGRSVIFLPSHKSHIDYIVLQKTIYRLGLGTPAIAAGDNLNMPLIGSILRRNGAFYIRRSFHGADHELYSAVVSAYLEGLISRGANLKFFIEGGRSRNGKLLQPKTGMLSMLLEPILNCTVEDAYLVPVSVYYDRVMETRTYVTELLGAQKRKESLGGLVNQARALMAMEKSRYGNIHVRIAPGFSAKAYIAWHIGLQRQMSARPNFNPQTSSADFAVLLKALAYHVLEEINRVSSVTPTALVGTALLCSLGRGLSRTELIQKVDWLREEVVRSGGHMSRFFDFPGELTAEVVDSALAVLGSLVERTTQGVVEPVYAVANGRHFELSYYRNMCAHVFIHQSIIACVLHRFIHLRPDVHEVRREEVMHDTRFLSRLMKYEFVFSGAAGRPVSASVRTADEAETAPAPQPSPPPAPQSASPSAVSSSAPTSADWGAEIANTALQQNFDNALELMVAVGVIGVTEGSGIVIDPQHRSKMSGEHHAWNTHFTFLCSFVWPLIESYWIVLAALHFVFERGLGAMDEASLRLRLQTFARTLVELGHVHHRESASEEVLRKALTTYREMGVVQWADVTDSRGERRSVLQIGPSYSGRDGLMQLHRLVEEIGSFRRFGWRQHEGIEDYPKHIAQGAFGPTARM